MAKNCHITEGYSRAPAALPVTIQLPNGETIAGLMLGMMHDRGALLHYRVSVGSGLCYLAPAGWIHPNSLAALSALASSSVQA